MLQAFSYNPMAFLIVIPII
ncbi:hypothetical protein KJ632_05060 [Patescibacteria group bacterium]|nr:hypothetical protein [Patescibacteria group bacterium]